MPTTHEESGLFNSGAWGDRYVTQVFWERLLDNMLHTGVIVNTGSEAQLTATAPPGMSCNISNFDALIKGYFYSMTGDPKTLTFDAPGAQPRYDLIVLRLERESDREISLYVLKGTEASSPTYPALTRTDDDVYELALWACLIQPTDTVLDLTEATSLINDPDYCGLFDVNYRGTAEGVIIPYSTEHTVYVPKWYNLTAPPSDTGYPNCSKWNAIDDDYIVGVNPLGANFYFLIHDRAADSTTWDVVATSGAIAVGATTDNVSLLLNNGKIYMWGFRLTIDPGTYGGRVAVYDIATGAFTYSDICPVVYNPSDSTSCGIAIRGSVIYIFRNTSCYAWDITTDTWSLECTYSMQYDYDDTTRMNYQRIFFVYDTTNDKMLIAGHSPFLSCWTYDFATAALTQHIDQQAYPPLDGIKDRIVPTTDGHVAKANGDNGIIYCWGTTNGQRSEGQGVVAINVYTGAIAGSIAYGYAYHRLHNGAMSTYYSKIDVDGRLFGFSFITSAPGTLYHNKIGSRYTLFPISTSTGNKVCVVGSNSALNAFTNITQGVGDVRGNVAIPLSAGDLYAINVDYTTTVDNCDLNGKVQIEVIGAN